MSISIVTNEDNMQMMSRYPNNFFDVVCIDPPYGLGNRLSDGGGRLKNTPMAKLYRESSQWDILPNKHFWEEFFRVTKNQIVCGANYFLEYLPSTRGFVVWDKRQSMPTLSACELIWTSYDCPAKVHYQLSTDNNRFHPTQKPIGLYHFLFERFCENGETILDCFLGSGSSRIAAYDLGFDFYGCEMDKDYFEAQELRFKKHISQQRLFSPNNNEVQTQEKLF